MAMAVPPCTVLVFMVSSDRRRSSHRALSSEEQELWAGFTRSIVRLRHTPKQLQRTSSATKIGDAADNPVTPAPRACEVSAPSSLLRRERKRLARGTGPIDARLDLHGKTKTEAHAALLRFLRRAQADGAKFVLVITGKGERFRTQTGERSTLRREVPLWFSLPELRSLVSAYSDAHAEHGGAGALYVRLRRLRDARC
jgi:DNA-nicking Smr family endonuclease